MSIKVTITPENPNLVVDLRTTPASQYMEIMNAFVGPAGPVGQKGAGGDGVPGEKGEPGTPGLQGIKGDVGPVGPAGATGDTGATGAGTKGDVGPTGAKGDVGPIATDALLKISVLNVDSVVLTPGMPVALFGAGTVVRASMGTTARDAIGLVMETSIGIGGTGFVLIEGKLTLPVDDWTNATNVLNGLTANRDYYIDIPGRLSITPPPHTSGNYSCIVGKSLDATTMIVGIQPAFAL